MKLHKEAIELEELNANISGEPKSDLLARLYRTEAHMFFTIDKTEEAIASAEKSMNIYTELGNMKEFSLLENFIKRLGKGPVAVAAEETEAIDAYTYDSGDERVNDGVQEKANDGIATAAIGIVGGVFMAISAFCVHKALQ